MSNGQSLKRKRPALTIALVGVMAATLECVKLALSALPNIEAVTLLTALFSYVFGWYGLLASIVFVCIEPLIYGFNTWVVSYFLYWPLVSAVFMLLSHKKLTNRWLITLIALILTAWFGVLTSLVDIGLLSGFFDNFFYRFSVYYARGAIFYIAQIATNAVLFPLLFTFLSKKLFILKTKLYL